MKLERGQLVMADSDINRKSIAIILGPWEAARPGWYYVFNLVEGRYTVCHRHCMTLLKEDESEV